MITAVKSPANTAATVPKVINFQLKLTSPPSFLVALTAEAEDEDEEEDWLPPSMSTACCTSGAFMFIHDNVSGKVSWLIVVALLLFMIMAREGEMI